MNKTYPQALKTNLFKSYLFYVQSISFLRASQAENSHVMHTIRGVASDAYHVQSTRTFRVWFSKIVDCLGRHSSSKQECQDSSSLLYSVLLAVMKGSWFLQKRKTVFMKKLSAHSLVFSTRVTGQSCILEICLSPFNLGEV